MESFHINELPDDALLLIFKQLGISTKKIWIKDEKINMIKEEFEDSDDDEDVDSNKKEKKKNKAQEKLEKQGIDRQLNKLTLVCKRWKHLIDEFHIYQSLTFFRKARSQEEQEFLLGSRKKFHSLKVITLESDVNQLGCLENYLAKSESLWEANINTEMDFKIMTGDSFLKLLKNFSGFTKIQLQIDWNLLEDFADHEVEFPNLKHFSIDCSNFEDLEGIELILAKKLEVLVVRKLQSPNESEAEWVKILSFLEKNGDALKSVTLYSIKDQQQRRPYFSWDPSVLVVSNCSESEMLKRFLKGRVKDLTMLSIMESEASVSYSIVQEARELKYLIFDIDFIRSLPLDTIFPFVRKFRITKIFNPDINNALARSKNLFPNGKPCFNLNNIFEEFMNMVESIDQTERNSFLELLETMVYDDDSDSESLSDASWEDLEVWTSDGEEEIDAENQGEEEAEN